MEFCRILSSFGVCRGKLPCYRAVGGGGYYLPQRFANYIARGEHARFIGLHSLVANYVTRLVGLHKACHKLGRRLVAKFYEQTAALSNAGGISIAASGLPISLVTGVTRGFTTVTF